MVSQGIPTSRGGATQTRFLSLAKTCSIGSRPGEQGGKRRSSAPHAEHLLASQGVADDNVALRQPSCWVLRDGNAEGDAVRRFDDDEQSDDAVQVQPETLALSLSLTMRQRGDHALAVWAAAPQSVHVAAEATPAEENQAIQLQAGLGGAPRCPRGSNVGALLLRKPPLLRSVRRRRPKAVRSRAHADACPDCLGQPTRQLGPHTMLLSTYFMEP